MTQDPIEAEIAQRPSLTIRQQKMLRAFRIKEFKENGVEDYVYGQDDEFAERGAPAFK